MKLFLPYLLAVTGFLGRPTEAAAQVQKSAADTLPEIALIGFGAFADDLNVSEDVVNRVTPDAHYRLTKAVFNPNKPIKRQLNALLKAHPDIAGVVALGEDNTPEDGFCIAIENQGHKRGRRVSPKQHSREMAREVSCTLEAAGMSVLQSNDAGDGPCNALFTALLKKEIPAMFMHVGDPIVLPENYSKHPQPYTKAQLSAYSLLNPMYADVVKNALSGVAEMVKPHPKTEKASFSVSPSAVARFSGSPLLINR